MNPLKGLTEWIHSMTEPRFPDVEVQLTGQDGNVFNLIGIVSRAIPGEYVKEFRNEVLSSSSYEEALTIMCEWVNVS